VRDQSFFLMNATPSYESYFDEYASDLDWFAQIAANTRVWVE
jgi:hypothetical protein